MGRKKRVSSLSSKGVVAFDPPNYKAYLRHVEGLRRIKDYGTAIRVCEKAVKKKPERPEAWHEMGFACGALKRYDEAMGCYDRALTLNVDGDSTLTATILSDKGDLFHTRRLYEDAIQSYAASLEVNPSSVPRMRKLIRIFEEVGDSLGAKRWRGKLKVLVTGGECVREDAVAPSEVMGVGPPKPTLDKNQPEYWYKRGNRYYRGEKYEKAITCYGRFMKMYFAVKKASGAPAVQRLPARKVLKNKLLAHRQLGDRFGVIDCLDILASFLERGEADTVHRQIIGLCDEVLAEQRDKKDYVRARETKGEMYSRVGESTKAAVAYFELAEFDGENAERWYKLARMHGGAAAAVDGRDETARQIVRESKSRLEALVRGAEDEDEGGAHLDELMDDLLEGLDEEEVSFDEGLEEFDEVTIVYDEACGVDEELESWDLEPRVSVARGEIEQELARLDRLAEYSVLAGSDTERTELLEELILGYGQLVKKDPACVEAWFGKAHACFDKGVHREALRCCDEVIALSDSKEAWHLKGTIYQGVSEYEKAIPCYDEVLRLDPKDELALFNQMGAYVALGRYSDAERSGAALRNLKPMDAEVWTMLGDIYYELREFDKSDACYAEVNRLKRLEKAGQEEDSEDLIEYDDAADWDDELEITLDALEDLL